MFLLSNLILIHRLIHSNVKAITIQNDSTERNFAVISSLVSDMRV